MNKKILLIAIIALMLSMSVVSAQQFKNKEYDGFSIDVPKNSNFVKQPLENNGSDELLQGDLYVDEKGQFGIMYVESPVVSEKNADYLFHQIFQSMNPNLDECYETQIGNMKLSYPVKNSDLNLAIAGINDENRTVLIFGQKVSSIEKMGKSVEFN